MEKEPDFEQDDDYIQGTLDAMFCAKCQALTNMECYCDDDEFDDEPPEEFDEEERENGSNFY